jgi:hypothetical protein
MRDMLVDTINIFTHHRILARTSIVRVNSVIIQFVLRVLLNMSKECFQIDFLFGIFRDYKRLDTTTVSTLTDFYYNIIIDCHSLTSFNPAHYTISLSDQNNCRT